MKNEIRDIPDPMKPLVIPGLFSNKYSQIDPRYMFYTDGSSIDGGIGFGIVNTMYNEFHKLAEPASVYVAELAAINRALELIEELPANHFFIFTDSLSSIESIKNINFVNRQAYFVLQIRKRLTDLGLKLFKISLVWVPAHCFIPGNELADELAKKGATHGTIFERFIAYHEYFAIAHEMAMSEWQSSWDESEKGRFHYSIHPKVKTKAWFKGLDLTRDFIRVMSRIMSNHYRSNVHHFRINMSDTNICGCGNSYDDIDHVVWVCPQHMNARSKFLASLQHYGKNTDTPIRDILARQDLEYMKLLYDFIKSSKIQL